MRGLLGTDTGRAAGLAGASLASNAIQLVFTVSITRVLGSDDYGALAALISLFLILYVVGQAVQAAAARETALEALGDPAQLRRTVGAWERTVVVTCLITLAGGLVLHHPLAAIAGTPEHAWAAATVPATGAAWVLLSLQRGVLQGLQNFRPVAKSMLFEAGARLVFGVALAIPAGVTGAFIATPLAFAAVSVWLALVLRRRLDSSTSGHAARTIRSLVTQGWLPVLGLVLLAVLQNIDVVIARHRFGHDRAGHYAVAAVAAKTVVWVSIGVGLQLLPQAAARATQGLDPRPVLARALAVLGVVTVPALIVFSVAPRLLLKVGFGPDTQDAAPALLVLGVAMACLAVSILTVQFLIALGQPRFPPLLALGATVEIVALATGSFSLVGFARVVAATQVFVAIGSIALAARAWRPGAPPPPVPLALKEA